LSGGDSAFVEKAEKEVVQEAVAADECLESVKREVFGNGEDELGGNRNEG
jgi:hypothetical protein